MPLKHDRTKIVTILFVDAARSSRGGHDVLGMDESKRSPVQGGSSRRGGYRGYHGEVGILELVRNAHVFGISSV